MDRQPFLEPSTPFLADPKGQQLCAVLEAAGHQALFVGGCVRNAVMGVAASDVDLSTDAHPETVSDLCKAAGLKVIPTGIEHGTVTVVIKGAPFEVTTFRRDVATDGRRAVVAFADTLDEDAQRRDFTMNALYADIRGQIFDPVGGLPDALARHVRFVGDAETRIREDYLRTLRFFRFSAWYGDPAQGWASDALSAIAETLDGLETLSAERVGAEMLKLLAAPDPVSAVSVMAQVGVLHAVLPGADPQFLGPLVHFEAGDAPNPYTRLAALGGDDVADRLRLSRKGRAALADIGTLAGATHGPKALGHLAGMDVGAGAVLLRAAMFQTPPPEGWHAALAEGHATSFPVTARDLPDLQGPALGREIKALKQRWLASELNLTRDALLQT